MCKYVYDNYMSVTVKEATLHGYNIILKRIEGFPITNAKVNRIKSADIQELIKYMQNAKFGSKKGYSPKTIKSTISFISACYDQIMRDMDGVYDNPCTHVKLPKQKKADKRTLTATELPIFIKNLDTLNMDTRVMFELASQMRHSDATTSLSIYTHMLESVSDSSKKFASKIDNFYTENMR